MLSQTCINLFLVVNTKEDISKNVGNQTVVCSAEERNSLRFKTNFEWVNDGINIKHYDRIDRQMTEFIL